MPTNVNYTSLVNDVTNYVERGLTAQTDPTVFSQIPRLINAAERNLAQIFKLLGQKEALRDPAGLQANVSVVTKPDRWRKTVSMNYGTGTNGSKLNPILPRSYEYCRTYAPDVSVEGPPEFYSDYDINHWLIVPTPDQTYPLEVICYMQPPLLDQTNQTNFWSDLTPNALVYATLLETAAFLKQPNEVAKWEEFLGGQVASLTGQDLQRMIDQATQRDGT